MSFLSVTGLVFGSLYVLPSSWATLFGLAAALVSGAYSVRQLFALVSERSALETIRSGVLGVVDMASMKVVVGMYAAARLSRPSRLVHMIRRER